MHTTFFIGVIRGEKAEIVSYSSQAYPAGSMVKLDNET